jgi:Domain of unknown function (DUF4338)
VTSARLVAVTEPMFIQGRAVSHEQLSQIRQLLSDHPDWSRYRLSRQLATLWEWRTPIGQLKDMAARSLLLKLQQRGLIQLPARRWASPNRMRHKRLPLSVLAEPADAIESLLEPLMPLELVELSQCPKSPLRTLRELFEAYLHRYHYLSYRSPIGQNLQYLLRDRDSRPLGCALFGSVAWKCAPRDQYVGWDSSTRARQLNYVTNNTRLLILPWVRVPHLASHFLGLLTRRLSRDWQRKYGHPIYLVETFVDTNRFAGTCYQGANWVRVGQTQGRGRQGRDRRVRSTPIKEVYLYALVPDFRMRLQNLKPHCQCTKGAPDAGLISQDALRSLTKKHARPGTDSFLQA